MLDTTLVMISIACLWAITDKHVPTGVVVTIGLLMVLCGCLAGLDDTAYYSRSIALRDWGLAAIGWGVFWRFSARRWWVSLSSRWDFTSSISRVFGLERRQSRREETRNGT